MNTIHVSVAPLHITRILVVIVVCLIEAYFKHNDICRNNQLTSKGTILGFLNLKKAFNCAILVCIAPTSSINPEVLLSAKRCCDITGSGTTGTASSLLLVLLSRDACFFMALLLLPATVDSFPFLGLPGPRFSGPFLSLIHI